MDPHRWGSSDLMWIHIGGGSGVTKGDLVWIQISGGSNVVECAVLGERREDGVDPDR